MKSHRLAPWLAAFAMCCASAARADTIVFADVFHSVKVASGDAVSRGLMRGRVIDKNGKGVKNVTVYSSNDCGVSFVSPVSVSDEAGLIDSPAFTAPSPRRCNLFYRFTRDTPAPDLTFPFEIVAVRNTVYFSQPAAVGPIILSLQGGNAQCSFDVADYRSTPAFPPNEAKMSISSTFFNFTTAHCGAGQPVDVTFETTSDLPAQTQWWQYGPTDDNPLPHWYTVPSTVSGNKVTFTLADGGNGDNDKTANGAVDAIGMLAIPGFQDLWWSGPAENGWGMSIVQHRDVLFANIFVYDAQGNPTWYVLPSGSWDAAHTSYSGNLYLPKGSPFYAYDVSKFDIGAPVGNTTLTFRDSSHATFAYTINGVNGRKEITRAPFGPFNTSILEYYANDLYWAGASQNGWGLAVLHQYASLFILWFTYDADGKPTWFVMPNNQWDGSFQTSGRIYKPVGPAWLGVPYDPSRHRVMDVGSFRLDFAGIAFATYFDYSVDGRSALRITLNPIPF